MELDGCRIVEENSIPVPESGCWIWTAAWGRNGYGAFIQNFPRNRAPRKILNIAAHRLSFTSFRGVIPAGFLVCHSCDIPVCVNPAHLFLGTYVDNKQDMLRKGRGRTGDGKPYAMKHGKPP